MLYNGNEFNSFILLRDKVLEFEWAEGVELYIGRSRSIYIGSKAIGLKKDYNENIKYDETYMRASMGERKFNTTSTGERPNQK